MVNRDLPPNALAHKNIYKAGVSRFEVCITRNYQKIYIGNFPTVEEAISARDTYLQT
jgi:hypothetical protein